MSLLIVSLIIYAGVGIVAGLFSGLLGIGGGLIIVPCLVYTFRMLDFPPVCLMQLSIGTALAAMIFNTFAAAFSHSRHGGVLWDVVRKMTPGTVLGSIIGAFIAHILPTPILQLVFAVFAIILGLYFLRHRKFNEGTHSLPSKGALNGLGCGIGALSNILGIGGGTITVPVFVSYKVPLKKAIGTSVAIGVIITTVGALAYLSFGFKEDFYPYTLGYIYLPAFAIIAVTSFFFAPVGARLSHRISPSSLRYYFSFGLMAIGILMLLR